MKTKAVLGTASLMAAMAILSAPASADTALRGGMTSIKNVASTLASQQQYADFKWHEGRAVSAASPARGNDGNNFKWASRKSESDVQTAAVENADAVEARHKWGIKADATQARHKWGIKADANQARHKWGIKTDANQARHKWGIKADATQARHKWGIK